MEGTDNLDLQLIRRRAGVDQIDLALYMGVHQGTLSRFETGRIQRLPGDRGRSDYLQALAALEQRGAA